LDLFFPWSRFALTGFRGLYISHRTHTAKGLKTGDTRT
jgi:hypothetical protein